MLKSFVDLLPLTTATSLYFMSMNVSSNMPWQVSEAYDGRRAIDLLILHVDEL